MSTTDAGAAVITPSGAELDPWVTQASTRHWLTGSGLPSDNGVVTFFTELRREGLRRAPDSTGLSADRLAAEPREERVTGGLLGADGLAAESVLPDGATGEMPATYLFHDRPGLCLMDRRSLTPSLRTLLRFAEATDELAGLRAQFASYADRYGPTAVEEAARHLLSVFRDGTDGEPAPFRKMAALIRPLSLAAGRAGVSGLALDLPHRLLDQEFGPGKVARFEDVDFPTTLTHEPTRRFLREVGLPEHAHVFSLDTDVPPATLAECHSEADDSTRLPAHAARLIRLGCLVEDNSLVVDGGTGAVLIWSERDATLHPVNRDVSTFAFTLWQLHRERATDAGSSHGLTADTHDQLAMTMLQVLSAVDPTGVSANTPGRHHWTDAFRAEAGGVA